MTPRVRCVLVVLAVALASPASAAAAVPRGFLGVMADGPLFEPRVSLDGELAVMRAAGTGSVRFVVDWSAAQPDPGLPTDFSAPDSFVAAATRRRLALLPVVVRTPPWAREEPGLANSPPSMGGRAAYAQFLDALVRRYGPRGAFWAAHPELPPRPLRRWQIWNEPAGVRDWSAQPGLPAYVELLIAAHAAVKAADPGARVVLAGLVGHSWQQLEEIYRRGGGDAFDVAAIHPFSARVSDVLKLVRYARAVMRRHGDARKSLLLTEVSWPSAKHKTRQRYGFEESERGQATMLRDAVLRIAAARRALRVGGLYWSTWLSYDRDRGYPFDYAGLRRFRAGRITAKPAFYAFRRVARRLRR